MNFEELLAFAGRHAFYAIALVGITIALLYTEIARLFRPYKALRPAALTALINRENALVVDISPLGDFEKGHIVGSKHVLPSQLDAENKLLAKVKELPLVVVCRTGMTSPQAAKRLVKAGFTRVHVLDGGIGAWQGADLPLAKGRAG